MQYHQNGFLPGDPSLKYRGQKPADAPSDVDVLIVGCGPAGLTLAAQMAQFPEITTRIIEQNSGPLEVGQADGIACRSMEMFEAFGFAHKVEREAYWVNETCFWRPGSNGCGLTRTERIIDVEEGLSEFPHTILSQARVHDFFLEVMKNSPSGIEPDYGCRLVELNSTDNGQYPIVATCEIVNEKKEVKTEIIRAQYVVGCDGARSSVRKSLNLELVGKSARQLWGVMDMLAVTNFPDIRLKCAIQSADQGSLLIIPREGGYLVRMYIELDELGDNERASDRNVTAAMLIEKAKAILDPFHLDVKEVAWWSAYEIGQRVCETFDDREANKHQTQAPRVFIAGDACHTHSPKAGQGMNVSMADTFNLGWKLASVVLGRASEDILQTYSTERRAKAKELIDFDRDMAALFSARPKSSAAAKEFQRYFAKHARYTAGVETCYAPSMITGADTYQSLAKGFQIGMRFHSAPVIRLADAKPMQLGHMLKADGRWRIVAFGDAGERGEEKGGIAKLCDFLQHDACSPLRLYTREEENIDAVIDVRAVLQQRHQDLHLEQMPPLLLPAIGRHGLRDYEKVFCPHFGQDSDIFTLRGIAREKGAMVVVRPDQYVAQVLALDDWQALCEFFAGFLLPIDK